jgi:hypothetical protein
VHGANDAESSLHTYVTPDEVLANPKLALVVLTMAAGPDVIVGVAGGVGAGAVIVHDLDAVALSVPAALTALTRNWWPPSASPEYAFGLVHASNAAASRRQR